VRDAIGLTVSELSLMIREMFMREPRLKSVTVRGEVSGFRHQVASGHWYFSLKDTDAVINCVMFHQNTRMAEIMPRDGDSVVLTGYVKPYEKNSSYQIVVSSLRAAGTGDLFLRFEELKRRLSAEGLFDLSRKRTIPLVPRKVAVVTSGSGAAWQDILNVSGARNPSIPIVLISVLVQGERAAEAIAAGISAANTRTDADVIIVARGGGSAEDLWCFNEEIVARAVAGSRLPVVSGVGHEIDTTICDLAADVRAATPSNAAEIVFPDRKELAQRVQALRQGLMRETAAQISAAGDSVHTCMMRLSAASPERRIAGLVSGSGICRTRLEHAMQSRIGEAEAKLLLGGKGLRHAADKRRDGAEAALLRIRERLEAISPLQVLERGYSMVTDRDGKVLTAARQAREAERIGIRFADGSVEAVISENGG